MKKHAIDYLPKLESQRDRKLITVFERIERIEDEISQIKMELHDMTWDIYASEKRKKD